MLILIMPLIALLTPNELRVSRIIPDAREFSLGVDFARVISAFTELYRSSINTSSFIDPFCMKDTLILRLIILF